MRFISGRTPNQLAAKNASTNATFRAKLAASKSDSVSVVISAINNQPMTSLIAAALMAMTPIEARVMLNSIMMRPSIGNAVIENAVAMNRADATGCALGDRIGALIR